MSDYVYYYFCKKLCECVEMLVEMDISEEKRDELNDVIQNVIDKLYEERQMKVVIEFELDEKVVGLFENKMKDYDREDLDKFIREDIEGLVMNELDESLMGGGFFNY